jgi:predicted transcriptional regulator
MMARTALPRPTDGELAILRVLWTDGPATVRDVHAKLQIDRVVGYTTVLKLLQIMTEKGLVRRDESDRTHVYRAAASADHTQKQLVRDLLDRAFGGSAQKLILHALSARKASRAELDEIRRLLDHMKGDEK